MLIDIKKFQHRPSVAIHKFSSCDGCQLALLNAGMQLLQFSAMCNIVHFVEAGTFVETQGHSSCVETQGRASLHIDEEPTAVDIAFVEGSISTADEAERIKTVRKNSKFLITIGACATSGGIQALRNLQPNVHNWTNSIYAKPEFIDSLDKVTAIADHVRVDLELWGCPVNTHQVLSAVRALMFGVTPYQEQEKLCLECKRLHNTCVMVSQGIACMGPVTQTGCGAICPSIGRDCYACYGPAEGINTTALGRRIEGLGYQPEQVARKFLFINNAAPDFATAAQKIGE